MADQFGYADTNNPDIQYSFSQPDSGSVMPPPAVGTGNSTVYYRGRGNYLAGLPKYDSNGVLDTRTPAIYTTTAPQAAQNNFESSDVTITGYYPVFWGWIDQFDTNASAAQIVTAINTMTPVYVGGGIESSIMSGAGAVEMQFDTIGKKMWFAIFSGYPAKGKWAEVGNETFNSGTIGQANDLFNAPVLLACNSISGYWSGIDFNIYISNTANTMGTLKVSVN